jgi:hypothetical protein
MPCHGPTIYGSPPTFTATVNKNATITFYLDDVLKTSELGLSASFTPDVSIASGKHHVRVVAGNGNENDEKTCQWHVNDPYIAQFSVPQTHHCIDVVGSTRSFTAWANKPATLEFFVDEESVGVIHQNTQMATLSDLTIESNEHTIEIVATTSDEEATAMATWLSIAERHLLTIIGGTIDDEIPVTKKMVPAGSVVQIVANTSQPGEFVMWNPHDHTNTFGDQLAATTTFVMPDHDVTVTAAFRQTTQIVINPNQTDGTYTGYSLSTHMGTGMKMVGLSSSYQRFSFAPDTLVDNVRYFNFQSFTQHPGAVIDFTGVDMGTQFLGFAGWYSNEIDISNLVVKIENPNSFPPFENVRNVTNVDIECLTRHANNPNSIIGFLRGEIKNSRLMSYTEDLPPYGVRQPYVCVGQVIAPNGLIGPGNTFSCSER